MKPYRLAPKASADLDQIAAFIARDNPLRAATFVEELLSVCRRIPTHPENYPRRSTLGAGLRVAIHKSYLVFFRILPEEIRIERVLHSARNAARLFRDES
jgi:toxin ParE1/3/4